MDVEQREDQIRFLAHASLSFPAGQISRVREMRASRAGESGEDVEMVVTFLGLTGPSGVLPRHYSELLIQRIREKDFALRDFLDLFQDRLVSLFYQSWKKHRLPIGYENWQFDGGKETLDLATWALYCLVGLGTDGLRGRLSFDDRVCLYFSGHYAHSPSSAIALECLLGEYLELPVCVQQLQGQWLLLDRADQAQLPDRRYPDGHNNQLGLNLIVGDRVWDVQSKFQLRIGPLRWGEFRTLLPIGRLLPKVCDLTRLYVGPELDYDIQLVLDRGEVPESQLSPSEDQGLFLGWTTWLCGERLDRVASDAVFAAIESPVRR
jgi:type VI secretion system protein ImpH